MTGSRLSLEGEGENLSSPEKRKHNLLIGIHGAVGVGKTTLARLLEKKFGIKRVEETFEENPYLKRFYTDPPRWSFHSQTFFIKEKIGLMSGIPVILEKDPISLDPTDWQDSEIYAFVHYKMGLMTPAEYKTYLLLCKTLTEAREIPTPDLVISIHAPEEVVVQRIKDRAERERERECELWMLENYPDYFPFIAKRTEEWARENPHNVPIIIIDAYKNNYIEDPFGIFRVSTQIQEEVHSKLGGEENVVLPEVFKPGKPITRDPRAGNLSKFW